MRLPMFDTRLPPPGADPPARWALQRVRQRHRAPVHAHLPPQRPRHVARGRRARARDERGRRARLRPAVGGRSSTGSAAAACSRRRSCSSRSASPTTRSCTSPGRRSLAATVTGVGNGFFWPAQSTLLVGLTPPDLRHITFGMQRVVMNLGIGLGALVGGLIASTSHPTSFTVLFARRRGHVSRLPRGPLRLRPGAPTSGTGRRRPRRYADVAPQRRLHARDRAQHALHLRRLLRLRAAPGVREERGGRRARPRSGSSSSSTRS